MPTSLYMPSVVVEIAFNAGYTTPAASRTWTDVSDYVEADQTLQITRGRGDELGVVEPSQLTLTLDNSDGRFTPENAAGAYYPNVKLGRPIRVRATWGGVTYDRFTGYVTTWPVSWPDGTSAVSTVMVTAVSRTARMAAGSELRSIIEEEYLLDGPFAYYPLGEPEGATSAGNVAETRQPAAKPAGSGSAVAFGTGTGPGTDGLSAPVFGGGKYLRAKSPTNLSGTAAATLEAFVNCSATATDSVIIGRAESALRVTAAGKLGISTGGVTYDLTSSTVIEDGATHHVAVTIDNTTMRLYVDGIQEASGPALVVSATADLLVGGSDAYGPSTGVSLTGTIAHAAWYTSALSAPRILAHAQAGLTGFSGESSDARIKRLAAIEGVASAEVSADVGLSMGIAHTDTTGRTVLDLMRQVEAAESGVLFDGRDGSLVFHSRSHRYGATSAFTLSAAAQEVEASLLATLDDQFLTNEVSATREGGALVRVIDTASVAEHGHYRQEIALLVTSDDEVTDAANWKVNRYSEPRPRFGTIEVDLLNSTTALKTSLLAADISTRFAVSGLPAQAPASLLDMFIEGTVENIGGEFYTIGFNVSPAAEAAAWLLDSATNSVLGTSTILVY